MPNFTETSGKAKRIFVLMTGSVGWVTGSNDQHIYSGNDRIHQEEISRLSEGAVNFAVKLYVKNSNQAWRRLLRPFLSLIGMKRQGAV